MDSTKDQTKVISFSNYKKKKELDQDHARGRKPLYMNLSEGKLSGNTMDNSSKNRNSPNQEQSNFGERLSRIKCSLDRINTLMAELKSLSKQDQSDKRS